MARVPGTDLSSVHICADFRTADRDPTATDDINTRVELGDDWLNTVTGAVFKCTDATMGAAVWSQYIAGDGRDKKPEEEAAQPAAEEERAGFTRGAGEDERHRETGRSVPRHRDRDR